MKYLKKILFLAFFLTSFAPFSVHALTQQEAFDQYKFKLTSLDLDEETARAKAESDIEDLIEYMDGLQYDVKVALDNLETRVSGLMTSDSRMNEAQETLKLAKDAVKKFTDMTAQNQIDVQNAVGGSLPRVLPTSEFEAAHQRAVETIGIVNRILLAPDRPANVPTGDLERDFIPQVIRQLFRFAWVVVLISLVVSGVFLIIAKDNEERVTKARSILVFSIIGAIIVALSFAAVKAITDIDFFDFI